MNFDTSAWNAAAREVVLFRFDEEDFAINGGMNGKIAADKSTRPSNFGCAGLAN